LARSFKRSSRSRPLNYCNNVCDFYWPVFYTLIILFLNADQYCNYYTHTTVKPSNDHCIFLGFNIEPPPFLLFWYSCFFPFSSTSTGLSLSLTSRIANLFFWTHYIKKIMSFMKLSETDWLAIYLYFPFFILRKHHGECWLQLHNVFFILSFYLADHILSSPLG